MLSQWERGSDRNRETGDADLVLVHAKEQEMKAVEEGFFVNRHEVMYNDFISSVRLMIPLQ